MSPATPQKPHGPHQEAAPSLSCPMSPPPRAQRGRSWPEGGKGEPGPPPRAQRGRWPHRELPARPAARTRESTWRASFAPTPPRPMIARWSSSVRMTGGVGATTRVARAPPRLLSRIGASGTTTRTRLRGPPTTLLHLPLRIHRRRQRKRNQTQKQNHESDDSDHQKRNRERSDPHAPDRHQKTTGTPEDECHPRCGLDEGRRVTTWTEGRRDGTAELRVPAVREHLEPPVHQHNRPQHQTGNAVEKVLTHPSSPPRMAPGVASAGTQWNHFAIL